VSQRQVPCIEMLDDDHTLVIPQFPIQLAVTDVECNDARGAALQQYISEAAGRCADVQAFASTDLDMEGVERVSELEAAAAGVWMIRYEQGDRGVIVNRRAGFRRRPLVHRHLPSQDQRACTFTRGCQTPLDDELV
jgi:hypothetical protein